MNLTKLKLIQTLIGFYRTKKKNQKTFSENNNNKHYSLLSIQLLKKNKVKQKLSKRSQPFRARGGII